MYSAGAAAADLFRERGVLSMLGFQAGVSVSAEETRKRLIAAWEDPASRFRDASAMLARTWTGMLSMLSDAWFQFRNLVMEAGVFDFIKAAIQTVLDLISDLRERGQLEAWAKNMANAVINALEGIIKTAALVYDAFQGWRLIWNFLKTSFSGFASLLNRGLAEISDLIDKVRQKINDLGADAATIGKVLKFIPATSGLGLMLEQLEDSNVEIGKTGEILRNNARFWDEVATESAKITEELSRQKPAYERVDKLLSSIRKKAEEYGKEVKKAAVGRVDLTPEVATADAISSELAKLKATTAKALTELQIFYTQGKRSLSQYFDERAQILLDNYNKEIEMKKRLLAATSEEDPKKRLKIETDIFVLTEKYETDRIKLVEERRKAEEKAAQDILAIDASLVDMRSRILGEEGAGAMEAQFDAELSALDQRHATEIQKLKDLKASEDQIEEAHRLQQLERDKVIADQRAAVQQATLDVISGSLGYLEQAFADAYEASGESIKEFFYLQKAMAIASTIIQTYENAVTAYGAALKIPIVGHILAPIFAATAVAAGMAKVAAIASQSLAEGGMVEKKKTEAEVIDLTEYKKSKRIKRLEAVEGIIEGYSAHPKADNILVNATAGEFMQPVPTVKYYGEQVMQIIKKRLVPKEVFTQYLAGGGPVKGHSPHPKADNIDIKATAGEFMHPVDVVKYYGVRGMEVIKRKLVPREVIAQYAMNINPPKPNYSRAFQAGGPVSGAEEQKQQSQEGGGGINVVNVIDPNLMDRYVSTTHGQKNILNVLSQNAYQIKKILQAEG
jgi:hypothetical protein